MVAPGYKNGPRPMRCPFSPDSLRLAPDTDMAMVQSDAPPPSGGSLRVDFSELMLSEHGAVEMTAGVWSVLRLTFGEGGEEVATDDDLARYIDTHADHVVPEGVAVPYYVDSSGMHVDVRVFQHILAKSDGEAGGAYREGLIQAVNRLAEAGVLPEASVLPEAEQPELPRRVASALKHMVEEGRAEGARPEVVRRRCLEAAAVMGVAEGPARAAVDSMMGVAQTPETHM